MQGPLSRVPSSAKHLFQTKDIKTTQDKAQELESGMVHINNTTFFDENAAPFVAVKMGWRE